MLKLRSLAVLLLVAGFAGAALAQTGSIQGTVVDNSGAVVQGADVIVRNLETNAQRAVSSSAYELTISVLVAREDTSPSRSPFS